MNKFHLSELPGKLSEEASVLIIALGFDARCLSIIKSIPIGLVGKIIGVSNVGWADENKKNIDDFRRIVGVDAKIIGENSRSSIEVIDQLASVLLPLTKEPVSFYIDVTAFSHELLSIVVGLLHVLGILNKTKFLYIGANEYGKSEDGEIWLSRGVSNIRSVLGFPGTMRPSKKLHLVILAGFEAERALEIVTQYEPALLSIGLGGENASISDNHHITNRHFHKKIQDILISRKEQYKISTFEFSCIDPELTKAAVLGHIESIDPCSDYNVVVCPLNTKLSTIGVALAALTQPEIQICYAEPDEYNTERYATPGDEVAMIELTALTLDKLSP